MRILSDIVNSGTIDGYDIGTLQSRISTNESDISTSETDISSLVTDVASKAATTQLTTGNLDGGPLGRLVSIDANAGASTVTFTFANGGFEIGALFVNPI